MREAQEMGLTIHAPTAATCTPTYDDLPGAWEPQDLEGPPD